jgi:hypothetical protein
LKVRGNDFRVDTMTRRIIDIALVVSFAMGAYVIFLSFTTGWTQFLKGAFCVDALGLIGAALRLYGSRGRSSRQ